MHEKFSEHIRKWFHLISHYRRNTKKSCFQHGCSGRSRNHFAARKKRIPFFSRNEMQRHRAFPKRTQKFLAELRRLNKIKLKIWIVSHHILSHFGKNRKQSADFPFPASRHKGYSGRNRIDMPVCLCIDNLHQRISDIPDFHIIFPIKFNFKGQNGIYFLYIVL